MKGVYITQAATGLALFSLLACSASSVDAANLSDTPASINVEPVRQISGRAKSWISAGVEQMSGDTTYQIGFPVTLTNGVRYEGAFPFSELEFPLDATMLTVRFGAEFNDRILLNGSFKKALSEPNDNFIDKDWVTEGNPNQLDVYSESKVSDFSATIVDIDASYKFLRKSGFWLAGGGGYMHQDFSFDSQLIRQYSPSGLQGVDFVGHGEVGLTYDINYKIPYLMLRGGFTPNEQWSFAGKLAYSPILDVTDRDHHVYRNKQNRGDLEGDAVMLSLSGRYDFSPRLFTSVGLDYTYITADGDSDASFFGIPDHTVAEEVESSQFSVYLTLGFKFWSSPDQPKPL